MLVRDKINDILKTNKVNFLGIDFELFPNDFMRIKDESSEKLYTYFCSVKDFKSIPDEILDLEYDDFKIWKLGIVNGDFCLEFIINKKEDDSNE